MNPIEQLAQECPKTAAALADVARVAEEERVLPTQLAALAEWVHLVARHGRDEAHKKLFGR